MASFLDKVKIKNAIESRTKLDLGCDHISTANWMQFNVAYNKELVPKEKIDVNMETFTRMLPLTKPTFGRANINNRAFFVPYRVVYPAWNDFITDAVHVPYSDTITNNGSVYSAVPYTTMVYLRNLFITNNDFAVEPSQGQDPDIDFMNGNLEQKYVLTSLGRQAMKILQSLGYEIIWDTDDNSVISMLPLLSVVKVYVDWYWPSDYMDNNAIKVLESCLKLDGVGSYSGAVPFGVNQLATIFRNISFVCYDSDRFTSAWDNPSGPNSGNNSIINIPDTTSIDVAYGTYDGMSVDNNIISNNTPVVFNPDEEGDGSLRNVSQFVVTALKKLTDYMKRHQIAGARAIDRYLSRYGVQLSSEKLNRSQYLGNYKVPLQIGDVMSNADTDNSGLGNYAGKGIGYGQGHFDYETDEYGQFIIISSIVPAVGYYQGLDRNVMHINKLDFWTPEFDSLGTQPITTAEVYTTMNQANDIGGNNATIFGFTPRYSEYKVAKDRLTGDFRYASKNVGEDAWYLMRNLDPFFSGEAPSDIVHNLSFVQGKDYEQYNRIFQTATNQDDKFRMIYHFEIASYSPMKPLFENYEFDGGKESTIDANGVKLN